MYIHICMYIYVCVCVRAVDAGVSGGIAANFAGRVGEVAAACCERVDVGAAGINSPQTALKSSWKTAGVEPGHQEVPGCYDLWRVLLQIQMHRFVRDIGTN